MPPAPTRIVLVAFARYAMTTAVAAVAIPGLVDPSTREVLELRFDTDDHGLHADAIAGIDDRNTVLPDRLLVYTEDGDAAAGGVAEPGWRKVEVGLPKQGRGRTDKACEPAEHSLYLYR